MRRRWFLGTMAAAVASVARRTTASWAADKGPIRIGFFGPLTGNFSQTGKDMTDGFNLFWEEVGNKVAGREVKVIVEDSDPEPTGGLTKVRRLAGPAKGHTVAGGLLAATGYAIAPYLEQNKIPAIYPVMAPDDITQRKPVRWIVRTSFTSSQATHPLGDYAYKQLNLRRVATISMDYAFGWESNGGFPKVFGGFGGKGGERHWAPPDVQDYAPYLASLRQGIGGGHTAPHGRPRPAIHQGVERLRAQGQDPPHRHRHPHRRKRAQEHGRGGGRRHDLAHLQRRPRHARQQEVLRRLREALQPPHLPLLRR